MGGEADAHLQGEIEHSRRPFILNVRGFPQFGRTTGPYLFFGRGLGTELELGRHRPSCPGRVGTRRELWVESR